MKIERPQYEEAYRLAKEVYSEAMRLNDAQDRLEAIGMNRNSATDLIYGLKHFLNGNRYERKMSVAATEEYLAWIRRDYGEEKLQNALSALRQHIEYYSNLTGTSMASHRAILAKYDAEKEAMSAFVTYPEELSTQAKNIEGRMKTVLVNTYERSRSARSACIAKHGAVCAACGFDFGYFYGPLGNGFIHVHHLVDLATVGKEYEVDPVNDLRPVCPNCHAMLHRDATPARSILELKAQIAAQRAPRG